MSVQGPRGIQGPAGQPGKAGKRVSELNDLVLCVCSHALVFLDVSLFVLVVCTQTLRGLFPVQQTIA